ncbi:AMP-binding protein [Streptomyces fumanus]|uniref:Uncharacterized protein n=1 Tax=Streptomyces fumanus TaxID=67302 RepID=A0A919B1D6_9ACTN|nr:AMP-binding protein [Streptomyces fumanus]GHF34322.1 hypothetical protein GCM10018772_69960 [Streptomyces fumanus]
MTDDRPPSLLSAFCPASATDQGESARDDAREPRAAGSLVEALERLGADSPGPPAEPVADQRRALGAPGCAEDGHVPPSTTEVAEEFARQVRRSPDAPALTGGGRTLTYTELRSHVMALAADLADHCPPPSADADHLARVALYMQPTLEHVVALLALAGLNITTVPLDPADPPELLRQALARTGPSWVLVTPQQAAELDDVTPAGPRRHLLNPLDGSLPVTDPRLPGVAVPVAPPPGAAPRPLYVFPTAAATDPRASRQVPPGLRQRCDPVPAEFIWQGPPVDAMIHRAAVTLCGGGHLILARPERHRHTSGHRSAPARPARRPDPADRTGARLTEAHRPHPPAWVRLRRAVAAPPTVAAPGRVLVALTREATAAAQWQPFEATHARIVRVCAGSAYSRRTDGLYEVDPFDPGSLRALLTELAAREPAGLDWLHGLPLAVPGTLERHSLDEARRACLDAPTALLTALRGMSGTPPVRVWWLSHNAQPVEGPVRHPGLALLAGAMAQGADKEGQHPALPGDSHWVDLSGPDTRDWAPALATVMAEAATGCPPPRRLALRRDYWWQPAPRLPAPPDHTLPLLPAHTHPGDPSPPWPARPVHLVMGDTGALGSGISSWLLDHTDGDIVLVARRFHLPAALRDRGDRVTFVEADLARTEPRAVADRFAVYSGRLAGIVQAVGTGSGHQGAAARWSATEATLRAVALTERLIARYQPLYALYCARAFPLSGDAGRPDHAAADGLLDALARFQPDTAPRTVCTGVARGLPVAETGRVLERLVTR